MKKSKKSAEFFMYDTIAGMFGQYFNACYPDGCPINQREEVEQAFYAGILAYMSFLLSDKMPDNDYDAIQKKQILFEECQKVLKSKVRLI